MLFLNSLPLVEEVWLQDNSISQISGLEFNTQNLKILHLSNNPISSFKELYKLIVNINLIELSFNDIHFGRSPIVEENGYKEFVNLHLKSVRMLDGVRINNDKQVSAHETYLQQVKAFNDSLREVEESYQRSMKQIESQYQVIYCHYYYDKQFY